MQVTNLIFTGEELAALSDQKFFLLKEDATRKIISFFGELEPGLKKKFEGSKIVVKEMNVSGGKIFRGENYKQYPYVVLDCPRFFSSHSIFAFRTMFWWGHEFSFTLHLQGQALEQFRAKLDANSEILFGKEVFFCINNSPWQYDFGKGNYIPLESKRNFKEEIGTKTFIKLSRKLNLQNCESMTDYCFETFELFMRAIK